MQGSLWAWPVNLQVCEVWVLEVERAVGIIEPKPKILTPTAELRHTGRRISSELRVCGVKGLRFLAFSVQGLPGFLCKCI